MNFQDSVISYCQHLGPFQKFEDHEVERLYSIAYGMYEVCDYVHAEKIFTQLVLHDPFESRFWKGLASCNQMLGEYKAALHAWGVVCLITNHDSSAHFHAAECYLSLGEIDEAKKALECTQIHGGKDPVLFQRIEILKQQVEKNG